MAEVQFLAITPNAEELIERAARTCHRSRLGGDAGSRTKFIQKIIKLGHLSVLEHASATFRIVGGSRAFSHQLVRHRLASFSQRSQRYVFEKDFAYVVPPSLERRGEALKVFETAMAAARDAYARLLELKVPREDARFVLPNAVETELVMTANMREFRHIFELRCHRTAQWEIRSIAMEMLKVLKAELPAVFADFEMAEDGSHAWTVPRKGP